MKRRIFIAIDLPSALKQKIAYFISQWRWLPIRWSREENWHITLVPPVYLEDRELESLTMLLRKSRLGKTFPVNFSRVLLAPPGERARMIWLEGETPPELAQLKNKFVRIWARKPELPQPKYENRSFQLHVTLARFESGDLRELEEKTRVLGEINFVFEVKEAAMMESRLEPSGAEYEILAAIPLVGSN